MTSQKPHPNLSVLSINHNLSKNSDSLSISMLSPFSSSCNAFFCLLVLLLACSWWQDVPQMYLVQTCPYGNGICLLVLLSCCRLFLGTSIVVRHIPWNHCRLYDVRQRLFPNGSIRYLRNSYSILWWYILLFSKYRNSQMWGIRYWSRQKHLLRHTYQRMYCVPQRSFLQDMDTLHSILREMKDSPWCLLG